MAKSKKIFRIVWVIIVSLVALATILALVLPAFNW